MELKTKKYVLMAEFADGERKTFTFDELFECIDKRTALMNDTNVIKLGYRKEVVYKREVAKFDNNEIYRKIDDNFVTMCTSTPCGLCRYKDVGSCRLAFAIDYYEAKDGDNND